jgi:hypothetical protein
LQLHKHLPSFTAKKLLANFEHYLAVLQMGSAALSLQQKLIDLIIIIYLRLISGFDLSSLRTQGQASFCEPDR